MKRNLTKETNWVYNHWASNACIKSPMSTHQGSMDIPFQRWFKFKEAYSPLLVTKELEKLTHTPSTIIDPFGGCGTTAVTSQFLGVKPTIIEVNPFLADLAEAKLATYEPMEIKDDFLKIFTLAKSCRPKIKSLLSEAPSTFYENIDLKQWVFPLPVLKRIMTLRAAIEKLENEKHMRLFKVMLGAILVPLSNVMISGKGRKYRQNWEQHQKSSRDVDSAFEKQFFLALEDITKFQKRPTNDYKILRGDCREVISQAQISDTAFFSPPYPNSFDYTDIYNIELWILGYISNRNEESKLRNGTLRSHVQIKRQYEECQVRTNSLDQSISALRDQSSALWSKDIPNMVESYFGDLTMLLQNLKMTIKENGDIFMVVGDSSYAGIRVPVAEILSDISQELGYRVIKNEKLRKLRTSAQQGGELTMFENLIHLSNTK